MQRIRNLSLVGTCHIAKQSIIEVKEAIEKEAPSIVALELDYVRYQKLTSDKKEKFSIKDINIINLIGAYVEKKIGEKVGVTPGAEMKEAINLAQKNKINIALIDQDIRITLKRLKKELTAKEKLRFIWDIIKSMMIQDSELKIDLTKVPKKKVITKILVMVKDRYPSIYKVLVEERNKVMSRKLLSLMQTNKNVVAVVGAGHIEGITKIIRWNLQKKK